MEFLHGFIDVPTNTVEGIQLEISRYLSDKDTRMRTTDILHFWKNRQDSYPMLSVVAKKILPVPATEVHSESVFSHIGNTITNRR